MYKQGFLPGIPNSPKDRLALAVPVAPGGSIFGLTL